MKSMQKVNKNVKFGQMLKWILGTTHMNDFPFEANS